nr:copper amine oxidase N-terminal domain-containing protein [Paenibacillus artemisiicola]
MPIEVLFDARKLASDVKPKLVDGTVLVPLRVIAEKMDGTIVLNGNNITVTKGKSKIELTIGSKTAVMNGKTTTLLQAATVENGRTLVPLRVISEGLNVAVEWDGILKFVWVGSKEVPSLKDVKQAVDFKPYLPYFKGDEILTNSGSGTYQKTFVVDSSEFPFKDDVNTYNRMDIAFDQNNHPYLQTIINSRASMPSDYYYLSSQTPAVGYGLTYLTNIPIKGVHFYYNDLKKIGGNLSSLSKINFFDIRSSIMISSNTYAKIMIKNPWRYTG